MNTELKIKLDKTTCNKLIKKILLNHTHPNTLTSLLNSCCVRLSWTSQSEAIITTELLVRFT